MELEAEADRAVDDDPKESFIDDVGVGDSKTDITSITNINGQRRNEDEDEKKSSTKGKGLKKWKRIQRTIVGNEASTAPSDGDNLASADEDPHRFLKRDSRRFAHGAISAAFPLPISTGGDSDNSEDPSSKSSTAASAPKFRYHHRTGNRTSSAPAKKASASYSQSGRPMNKIETSKKPRGGGGGGGFKIEKENDKDVSYSSVESDLRSSNFFFTESASNGRRIHYDVDSSSEAQASDQQSNDYFKGNGEEDYEEVSQDAATATLDASWEAKEGRMGNQHSIPSRDLLSESIISLHAVHQALEKEIQSFGEIGKEAIVLTAEDLYCGEVKGKLDSRVAELERELLGIKEEGEESKWRQEQVEEQLFKQKIESEVECLTLREKLKRIVVIVSEDQNNNDIHLLDTDTDTAAAGVEDPLQLRSTASMYGLLFCVQLIFLFLVFRLLFLQLWPGSSGFVPT